MWRNVIRKNGGRRVAKAVTALLVTTYSNDADPFSAPASLA